MSTKPLYGIPLKALVGSSIAREIKQFSDKFWEFLRDDLNIKEFELWVYLTEDLENILPHDLYYELLNFHYHNYNKYMLKRLKEKIGYWLETNNEIYDCLCIQFKNKHSFGISTETNLECDILDVNYFTSNYIKICKKNRWLRLYSCPKCNDFWCVYFDTDDFNYILVRQNESQAEKIQINNIWPEEFEKY